MADKDQPGQIEVAWLSGTDLRPYRVRFLERLADRPEIRLTVFHGNAKPGIGAPDHVPSLPEDAIHLREVHNRFWPFGGHRVFWQSGALALLQEDFDVLVIPEIIHNLSVWLIALLHRRSHRRLVFFGFGYRPGSKSLSAKVKNGLRRLLIRRADAIISYTDRGRVACEEMGIPRSRLFVTRNTLDTEHLRSLISKVKPFDVAQFRTQGTETGVNLIFIGRLVKEKRIEVLLQAFAELRDRDVDASLTIVGDGPERPVVEDAVRKVDRIRFLGSIYDEIVLAKMLLASDLLVIPGRVGLTCIHGFCYSVPTITTVDSVVSQSPEYDYLDHNVNGIILDRLDPHLYADTIERLERNRTWLQSLGTGAERSASHLTMSHMVEQYIAAVSFAYES